jgi:NAD+ kinase
MEKIALLYHPKIPDSIRLARNLERVLRSSGCSVWVGSAWEDEKARELVPELDLIVTLGGDGTILRAARMAGRHATPILGVNMGRLGFLTETDPDQAAERIPAVLSGDYWLEERIMLHAELHRQGQHRSSQEALNDVVVGHGAISRPVRLAIDLDGQHVADYVADGVIAASPTGSTAYSLAAGGPILHPRLEDILLTPIAPHRALDHSLVLPSESVIDIHLSTEYQGVLSIDGQIDVPLEDGDQVSVSVSPQRCNLVRMQPRNYFGQGLLERLKQ